LLILEVTGDGIQKKKIRIIFRSLTKNMALIIGPKGTIGCVAINWADHKAGYHREFREQWFMKKMQNWGFFFF
jgi:hypothetical protein